MPRKITELEVERINFHFDLSFWQVLYIFLAAEEPELRPN